jgi:hypothetical protein
MNGTHLGGPRQIDPLEGWRALAAAVVLQAVRDAREQRARCAGQPRRWCYKYGCSRCATDFLYSKDGLALLSLLLERRCTGQDVQALLACPIQLLNKPRKSAALSSPERQVSELPPATARQRLDDH